MDRHVLAAISIAGTSFDLLGGMYLAYDLLGGKHGPLRTLTRGVTYTAIFAILYGLPLGWRFGLAAGVAHGFTLAIEYAHAARQEPQHGLRYDATFSSIRGIGFGLGLYHDFGIKFAAIFAVLSSVGQVFAYRRGISPRRDYVAGLRPRIARWQLLAALNRALGYVVTALICGVLAQGSRSLAFPLKVGLSIGIATALAGIVTPYVEWVAENLPERRLGVFGICLIFVGFALQSVQYWTALLDIPVH
jgi:hypothetical protein